MENRNPLSLHATDSAREQDNGAQTLSGKKSIDSGSPEEPPPALRLSHS